jgi:hypothetical protein
MLHYQRYHQARPNQSLLAPHERTRFHTFLCCVAVITRIVGKVIAVINACWIFVWLFLTYPFQPRPTDFYNLRMVYTGY